MIKKTLAVVALLTATALFSSCNKEKANEPKVNSNPSVKTIAELKTERGQFILFSFEKGEVVGKVAYNDPSINTRTDWDLVLHYRDFGTNSGEGRVGKGGAFETSAQNVSDKITIPEASLFQVDRLISGITTKLGNHGAAPTTGRPATDATSQATPSSSTNAGATATPGQPATGAPAATGGAPSMSGIEENSVMLSPVLTSYGRSGTPAGFTYEHKGAIWFNGHKVPMYELSKKVYLVRTATGKYAAIKITDDTNSKKESGYITFEYVYPVQ